MNKIRTIISFLALVSIFPQTAMADAWHNYLRVDCIPESKSLYLTIEHQRTDVSNGNLSPEKVSEYSKKYNLYNFDGLLDVDDKQIVKELKTQTARCEIDGKTFEISMFPVDQRRNLKVGDEISQEGVGGIYPSLYLSVTLDSRPILQNLAIVEEGISCEVESIVFDLSDPKKQNHIMEIEYFDDRFLEDEIYTLFHGYDKKKFYFENKDFVPLDMKTFWNK